MCGIAGVVDEVQPPEAAVGEAMARRIAHRGPDARGIWHEGPVVLAHTRLAILDLSAAGAQPMLAPDGRVAMVYNGELYNHRALRAELTTRGHRFRGHSDSEVLLAGFLEWGDAVFERLNGMFAVAFWDRVARRLTLARDRLGIKPLVFAPGAQRIVFASEAKALFASGRVTRTPRADGVHELLVYGTPLGSRTAYAEVERLLPGHLLHADAEGVRRVRYAPTHRTPVRAMNVEEAATALRSELTAAVHRQLDSDVPVGVFLSGGIDSSAIAVLAARELGSRLRTYTAGFDLPGATDERPRARALARQLGSDHRELFVGGADLPAVLLALAEAHDQPFSDAANVPLYLLAHATGGETRVILQGDGGDELFAGYPRYTLLERASLLGPLARRVAPWTAGRRPFGRWGRIAEAMGAGDSALRSALLLAWERQGAWLDVLTPEARERVLLEDAFVRYRQIDASLRTTDPVQRMLETDLAIHLPDVFLEKVDKPTMAHGIEVRVPFLDNALVDFAMSIPPGLKVRNGQKKWILRRALRGVVPDAVLDAPKVGFNVPYSEWLRGELREFARDAMATHLDPAMFAPAAVERVWSEHLGRRADRGFLLWKLVQWALWNRLRAG
jgi:asparagine synthase (glutamine-hydrolysing)